ncbi:MAG: Methyltransferase type 11 [Rhodocyclales bacterium]|nr:Methyltransferase type 11 [Rhodocyclales bacterium]
MSTGREAAQSRWPAHAAARNTHNRVAELVCHYLKDEKSLRVCDLPCGAGLFSKRLADLGMNVTGVDIEAVSPFHFDESCRVLADANLRLPFEDGSFDAMVTIEGIEHLENPSFFLRECARVVRPGGLIFLSTPNVDSFRSRKYVLSYGYHRYFTPREDGSKDSGHLHPIDMSFIRQALAKNGLSLLETSINQIEGQTAWKEMLRPWLTRKLPSYMQGEIPFYGDVIIYVLRKTEA